MDGEKARSKGQQRYKAFISYSHQADDELASDLQRSLQSFAKPWYRPRAIRIFRDETDLTATPDAWSDIETALGNSDYFILLASPTAASSKWVKRELDFWLTNRSPETLLIVRTDGEIEWSDKDNCFDWTKTTALPRILDHPYRTVPLGLGELCKTEPLHVDFRNYYSTSQLGRTDEAYMGRVASIAARLHGKTKDEIYGYHLRERRRTRIIVISGIATFAIMVALGTVLWRSYQNERDIKAARLQLQEMGAIVTATSVDFSSSDVLLTGDEWQLVEENLKAVSPLSSVRIHGAPINQLDVLKHSPDMTTLFVDGAGHPYFDTNQSDWSVLTELSNLRTLILRSVPFGDTGVQQLPIDNRIRECRLTAVGISAEGLNSLLNKCPHLQALTLRNCVRLVISEDQVQKLFELPDLKELELVDVILLSQVRESVKDRTRYRNGDALRLSVVEPESNPGSSDSTAQPH